MKYDPYVLYVSRHDDETGTQIMVVAYAKAYQARKFLDVLLEDDGIVWEDCHPSADPGTTIRSESGIVVSTRFARMRGEDTSHLLRKAVEHEYDVKQMLWELPPEHVRWARRFRHGPPLPRTDEEAGVVPASEKRAARRASSPKKQAPGGYVHVSDIALSMGIDAKQARVALRKIYKDGKPEIGWNFPPSEIEELKAKIKEALK